LAEGSPFGRSQTPECRGLRQPAIFLHLQIFMPSTGPRSLSEIDFDSDPGKAADCSAAGGCSY
jgi:hypothetical protein